MFFTPADVLILYIEAEQSELDAPTAPASCGSPLNSWCFASDPPVFTTTLNCLTHFKHLQALKKKKTSLCLLRLPPLHLTHTHQNLSDT